MTEHLAPRRPDGGADDGARRRRGGRPSAGRRLVGLVVRHRLDVATALGLFVVGLVARRGALPTDGLIFDDAWVAVGAAKAPLSELFTVSTNHPGFTAALMAWARVVPATATAMAVPAFVAGAAAAPVLHLVLRRFGVRWPVGLAVSALLVVAPVHVQYSGRVKSYVVEGPLILLLAVGLPWLAARRWRWSTAVLWVVGAVLVGTFSVFALVAVAAAAGILVLHPCGDRGRRAVALAVQGVAQAVQLWFVQGSFDSSQVADDWESVYDGYIELVADPVDLARQLGAHAARVGDVLLPGPRALTLVVFLVAAAGLVVRAWRGPSRVPAQFLLVLPLLALGGAFARQIPFGTLDASPVFPGGRATLWLLPSIAAGLAFALDAVVRAVGDRSPRAAAPLAGALLVAAAVVVVPDLDDAPEYLSTGAPSIVEFVTDRAGADDVVVVLSNAPWPLAAVPGVDVAVRPGPETLNGFTPRFVDPQWWVQAGAGRWDGTVEGLRARLAGAPQVFIVNGFVGFADADTPKMEQALRALGYEERPGTQVITSEVSVWARPGATRPGQ